MSQGKCVLSFGLNVVFVGDFWQLDPPQATSLTQIPDFVLPAARTGAVSGEAEHGLDLVWGQGADGPTGLTEGLRLLVIDPGAAILPGGSQRLGMERLSRLRPGDVLNAVCDSQGNAFVAPTTDSGRRTSGKQTPE